MKLFLFLSLLFIYSCEGLFDAVPTVTYSDTNLDANFLEEGSSPAPSVNWNGTQGSFAITPEIEGVGINSTNGIVSWTEALAPGLHEFSVIATNNSGQISIPMTIDNVFQGTFTGTYSGGYFFELDFSPDGTIGVKANSSTDPNIGAGTWTIDGNTISANYNYVEMDEDYSIAGTLTQSASGATINGDWYIGYDHESGSSGGSFEVSLQK